MVQNQRRGGNEPAVVMLIVGGIAGAVIELVQNIVLSYLLPNTGMAAGHVVDAIEGLVTGAVVGGAVLIGRPRSYGIAAATGAVTFVAGSVGDEVSRLVLAMIHDWLISSATFTSYFTQHTALWWAIDLIPVLVATGLAALGVSRYSRVPLAPPPGPWGPQAPYGGPPHPGAPGQAPYGPGQAPWGPGPQQPHPGPPPAQR